ncbi:MAG TPA: hypothetical protein VF444_23755 [Pseudonocardiaceae bacterium]
MTSLETELLLRVQMRGVAEIDAVRALDSEIGLADERLHALVSGGALADDGGLVYVTELGGRRVTDELAGQVTDPERGEVLAFADLFAVLDGELKSALTAWQHAVRAGDVEAQMAAVQRWLDVDARLHAATAESGAATRLFGRTCARLAAARERVLDGDTDLLAGHDDASYHSVWFLLHEMLLRSLRRQRG